tara:strand:+ start:433 stop:675 length:243 start_codon:yes stop_codon:yes gene_type:complete
MADTVVTITDGSVSKSFTYPQARWDKVAAWWKREETLADTAAEFTFALNEYSAILTTLENKEITRAADEGASKSSAPSVS